MEIVRFWVDSQYGVEDSLLSYPIYDDSNILVGAFTVHQGDSLICFVNTANNPISLRIASREKFYFTPKTNERGYLICGIVSEYRLEKDSVRV